jgi:GT2 family glycosyltransferase
LRLDFRLAGTRERVLGPPIIHVDYQAAVQALVSLARCLTQGPDPNPSHIPPIDEGTSIWLKERILSPLIREFRGRRSIVHPVTIPLAPHIRLHPRAEREALVDVVIPVYQARDDTLACIDSVLRSAGSIAMALIVINDGSPDPEFNETLRDLAKAHDFLLLENQSNLGFVATANRGMHLHPGRDVVLLNSDTVVSSGWLDRLYRAAYSASNIGTVTPFSNNATICSFPLFCRENTVPAGISREELDRVFAEVNAGQTVDLPTAVGFCMYIRRDVLDEVGYFDEASWAQGYGEENDFCLRAAAAGWRNVAGCDVFVEHAGGRSFGDKRLDFVRRNLVKLNALYPDYPATVQVFIDHDPLAGPRNRVLKALLQRHSEKYLLTVIHSLGGGTQVAADAWMARHQADGDSSLELKCVTPNQWKLRCHGTPYELQYRFAGDFDALLQDLRELDVSRVEFHHVMQFPRVVWELPGRLSVPYDYILHDYLPICPRINMIDESGVYCGNAQYAADTCTRCIKVNGVHPDVQGMYTELGGDVASWRDTFGGFLQKARRVFAPSADASRRLRPHFKALQVEVTPHPESDDITGFAPRDGKDGVVAILGAIGLHKGYDILLSCVRNAVKDALPLRFAIIGYTCDDAALLKYENVTISGAYVREDLSRLIEQSGAGIALFLSPWPETYSFTLSEAWRGGLYPVAFDLGAIAERIRQAQVGRLIPLTTDPRVINGTLLEVFRETSPTQRLGHGESISEVPSKVQTD